MATFGFIGTGNMGGALARAARKRLSGGEILLANRSATKAEALAQEPVSSEFRMVGDCKRPRQILEAVRERYDAAMEV